MKVEKMQVEIGNQLKRRTNGTFQANQTARKVDKGEIQWMFIK
ncbi:MULTISPECIES: hypothetical protein [Planococcus]|nr:MULTISPECIES: hypothetical protein [Planococcus]MDJ0330385.1 hypothetical protein [Planococcus sp. S3-L1]